MGANMKGAGYNEKAEKELIGRARELQPLLRRSGPAHDKERRLTDEVFTALTDAGFWEMASPRRWGGLGTSATAMARVGAELGKGDPSVGWVYTVLHGTTWVASLGPDALQEEIFGSSDSHLTIEDSWFMNGMRGTGSETCVVEDVFVPSTRIFNIAEQGGIGNHPEGKKHVGEPSDYWPFMPFLRATAHGMVIGAAESMLGEVLEASKSRPIVYTTYKRQADSAVVQAGVGKIAAMVEAARLLMEKTCGQIDEAGVSRIPMSPLERAQSKGEGSFTIDLLAQACNELMFFAGSGAFDERKEICRYWRDLSVGARHVANLPYVGYEILGKAMLDVEPNISPADFI